MDGTQAIDVTPTKFSPTNTAALKKENEIKRKGFRICETKFGSIFDIPISSVNVESYICRDRCFPSLKHFKKL